MRPIFLSLAIAISAVYAVQAQVIQKSNVFVFDLTQLNDSTIQFSKPRYLTEFNATGYNNHPAFFNKNELCISVQMPNERQPDLYVFDLEKKTKTRITQTPEGEFSPQPMSDGFRFSAIRQEFTPTDTLIRLWEFPLDRLNNGRPVFKYQTKMGYYWWLNTQQVAAFLNNNPPDLAIGDVRTDEFRVIANNVGRCFRQFSNGNLVYVKKSAYDDWMLMQRRVSGADWINAAPVEIIETVAGAEDFVLLPDGSILMAKGSRIFHYSTRSKNVKWREVANLQFYDITNITRLAISPDLKLALVAD